jgi:1-acyl-sn-glycerol-3-phosphate acyltransferase
MAPSGEKVESEPRPRPRRLGEAELLDLIREVSAELHGGRTAPAIGPDTRLTDELGLDSLGRLELLTRIERRIGGGLGEERALAAETPRELLAAALAAAAPERTAAETAAVGRETAPDAQARPIAVEAPPAGLATLAAAFAWHARRWPERVHLTLEEAGAATPLTYGALEAAARRAAAGLVAAGVARGDSVALMLPTSIDFFMSFLGTWLCGAVPVPIYPPFRPSQIEEHLRRQARVLDNARATLLVASPETARAARWLRAALPRLRRVVTGAELAAAAGGAPPPPPFEPGPDDVALVQYTSGSTGDPKGVVLTHGNLLANVRAVGEAMRIVPDDVAVSWLPLYHDMGLIGTWLGSLYHACRLVAMSPTRFLASPRAWLWAIHHHRGTLTAAPAFGYEICATRIADADLEGLDLSSWRVALNGSEPVSARGIERFARRFAPYGFRPEAMMPVYGLAENTLALTFPPLGRGPRVDRVQRAPFERDGQALPAPQRDGGGGGDGDRAATLSFVSCGRPLPRNDVRVVGDGGRELPERQSGEVQFRGPSATRGYLRNERATRALRDGDWRRTGDVGYFAGGELHVTGRIKDVIIRAGRHVFPYELEEVVAAVPGVRRGGVAVFAAPAPAAAPDGGRADSERLVVVAETRLADAAARDDLRARIAGAAAAVVGAAPDDIVLAPPRAVPKTSSGKTRRAACRARYLGGELGAEPSPRRQALALAARAALPLTRRAARGAHAVAYAAWFWTCYALLAVPAWTLAVTVPGERARWRAVAAVIRAFFAATGIPVSLEAGAALRARPCVVVLNHASFIDAIALVAVLPPGFSFVAKSELLRRPLLPRALRRLGVLFVERFDARRSVEDAARLEDPLHEDRSLVAFPEGTDRRGPGVYPFHLGAFLAAARAGVPVVPGTITGTRAVLPSDRWFPRRARIDVALLPPMRAESASWRAAVDLRDRARAAIVEALREAPIG